MLEDHTNLFPLFPQFLLCQISKSLPIYQNPALCGNLQEALLDESKQKLEEAAREEKMKQEVIDVTLPAKKAKIGHRHPGRFQHHQYKKIRDQNPGCCSPCRS